MDELIIFYKKWQKRAFAICFGVWIILLCMCYMFDNCIQGVLNQCATNEVCRVVTEGNLKVWEYVISVLIDFLAPSSCAYYIYRQITNYIDVSGWKKKFPQLDISGEWSDITTYTKKFDCFGINNVSKTEVPSPVIINQTCQKIEIKQSIGEDFEWYSLMADWQNNKLIILYRVEYKSKLQRKGFPEQRTGVECMSIKPSDGNKRPVKMVGNFHHCVYDDNKPVFMGDVVYKRAE